MPERDPQPTRRTGKRCAAKKRYPDLLSALKALGYMRASGRTEKRVYRCNRCRGWHTTSQLRRWPEKQWHMGLA